MVIDKSGTFNAAKFRGMMAEMNVRSGVLAKRLKRSRVSIYNWKQGLFQPSIRDVKRIGDFFGIDYKDFLI